jgi:hypothetical protein
MKKRRKEEEVISPASNNIYLKFVWFTSKGADPPPPLF